MPPIASASAAPVADTSLNALLDAAVDAIVLADEHGRIARLNRAAERLFGYRQAEVEGHNLSLLMPEPYRREHDQYIHRYERTHEARIIGIGREVTARRQDGSTVPVELSVGEFRSAEGRGYVGILRDISERKRQQTRLEQQASELRMIFEDAPTPMLITEPGGHILKANRACCTLLGYSDEALRGRRQSELLFPDDRASGAQQLSRLAEGHGAVNCELRYLRGDGSVVHTSTHAARSEGGPALVISEILDRTALLSAEHEAETLRARLAHAARIGTLGEMVSGIAHEVNQPLTAIATYASACRRLLQSGSAEPAELVATLEKIAAQAERAGQVIRGLRSLTRRRDALREPLDVNQLIGEVAKLLEFELRNSGWRLLLHLSPGLLPVIGDGVQLQQVVLNLVRNGIEAMRERAGGDHVEVQTRAAEPGWLEICVRDSGPGISEAVAAHLFEPFYTTKPQGMGLGLSICQSIVASLGGELGQHTPAQGGACFTIRLPTAET